MTNLNRDDVIVGMKEAAERMGLDLEDLQEMIVDVLEDCSQKAQMLVKVADNYDEEVDVMVAGMVALLEPLMIVMLGGVVGFIVLALFLPMVKLITNLT